MEQNNFLWRLSNARIEAENQFSQFPGFDRKLAILEGDGLVLNGKTLGASQVFQFSGEETIQCRLKGSVVEDIGVIYKRDSIKCKMTFEKIETSFKWDLGNGVYFLIPIENSILFNQNVLEKGEFVQFEEMESLLIAPFQSQFAHVLLISIE